MPLVRSAPTVSEWSCLGGMEMVHIAGLMLVLFFLVFSCEGLPVEAPRGAGLEGEEMDQALALANRDLNLLELDILLAPPTNKEEEGGEEDEKKRRDLVADNNKLWPGGVVPYLLPSFISESFHITTASNAPGMDQGHCRPSAVTLHI